MDDPPGSYAPRSPDLSALTSASSYSTTTNPHNNPSSNPSALTHSPNSSNNQYLLPPTSSYTQPSSLTRHDSFSLPHSSYYQPPPLLQHQSSSSYGYSPYAQPSPQVVEPQSSQNKRIKRDPEDETWPPDAQQQLARPRPGRPPSTTKVSKASSSAAAKMEEPPTPREPAPGELAGVVVKTKFPVARIKRIVQADDEVGKVAQVTPVAVGKALELFMIHLTLASADVATGATGGQRRGGGGAGSGTKRITSSHIKAAILKHDEFDFLQPIAEKIPDGPAGGGRGPEKGAAGKAESDDDMDFAADDGAGAQGDLADGTYGSRSRGRPAPRDRSSRKMQ